jgi:hypothetical protein
MPTSSLGSASDSWRADASSSFRTMIVVAEASNFRDQADQALPRVPGGPVVNNNDSFDHHQ